jgi:hypothetical protein
VIQIHGDSKNLVEEFQAIQHLNISMLFAMLRQSPSGRVCFASTGRAVAR